MDISNAHLRVARPARDLAGLRRFYVNGLGMSVLHEGTAQIDNRHWELIMCGFRSSGWHLELTRCTPEPVVPSPTVDDLLVLYLGDASSVEDLSTVLQDHGGVVVPSDNPYWDVGGVTLLDPDGYRLVVTARTWRVDDPHGANGPQAPRGPSSPRSELKPCPSRSV